MHNLANLYGAGYRVLGLSHFGDGVAGGSFRIGRLVRSRRSQSGRAREPTGRRQDVQADPLGRRAEVQGVL